MLDPLPIKQELGFGGNGAVPSFGIDADGFALYAALLQAKLNAGAAGFNALVSWPWDPRLASNTDGPQNMSPARLMLRPQLVKAGLQIDGVAWVQPTNGNYTAANSNQIGAYTYDGTQMNRVAVCVSDGTLWQSGGGARVKAFTTPYVPPADMVLWAAGLYNASAAVTVPQITSLQVQNTGDRNLFLVGAGSPGFALSIDGPAAGSANLPATIANANLDTTNTNEHWLAFYHAY